MSVRVVVDTNIYVSRYLRPHSVPGKVVEKVFSDMTPLTSIETWRELREVLHRPKFARFIQPDSLEMFLRRVFEISEKVPILTPIHACRDPRDDKFIELAVHGRADLLLTGDADLLALNPFHGVTILTPAAFLAG